LNELVNRIDEDTKDIEAKDINGFFRLPVDRVFSINGFGTVVTGTIISGSIAIGEKLYIYPKEKQTKVKGIQIYKQKV
jgi:selenocysteine-specific elongation factor